MWKNIGHKLQTLAKVICWIGIIWSLIMALLLWNHNSASQPTIVRGILYLVIGSLVSWIASWSIYGLGVVVEYVEEKKAAAAIKSMNSYLHASAENQSHQTASPWQPET